MLTMGRLFCFLCLGIFIFLMGFECDNNSNCGPLYSSFAKDEICKKCENNSNCGSLFPGSQKDEVRSNCELKIPKIIHHVWHSWKPGEENPTPYFQDLADTLKKNQPDWQYEFWDDTRSRDFIAKQYPDFLKTYDGYDKPVKRHDALRYFIMDYYGGVYLDMGFLSVKDIEPLLSGKDLVLSEQTPSCHSIGNSFLASVRGHAFWKFLISHLEARKDQEVIFATGPAFLTEMILKYKEVDKNISVLPSKYVFPFAWYEKENENPKKCMKNYADCKKIYPEAYLVKFWSASWIYQ